MAQSSLDNYTPSHPILLSGSHFSPLFFQVEGEKEGGGGRTKDDLDPGKKKRVIHPQLPVWVPMPQPTGEARLKDQLHLDQLK